MRKPLTAFLLPLLLLFSCEKKQGLPPNTYLGTNGFTWAMTVYNGKLIVGGGFTVAGSVACNNLAAWDGENWSSMHYPGRDSIAQLTTLNGNLIVAGTTGNVWEWNGATWNCIKTETIRRQIFTMIAYNGNLYAGGYINWHAFFEKWDGTNWTNPGPLGVSSHVIYSTAVYNGNLMVGGWFDSIGGAKVNGIGQWNDTTWSALGTGLGGFGAEVLSTCVYNGNLIAGGTTFAQWNDTSWTKISNPCPLYSYVTGVAVYDGNLVMVSNNIVSERKGNSWYTIARLDDNVNATINYNGRLIVCGAFTSVNGVSAYSIAQWNGSAWAPL